MGDPTATIRPVWFAIRFVIDLLGGSPCLGMCGLFVSVYANRLGIQADCSRWYDGRQRLLYDRRRALDTVARSRNGPMWIAAGTRLPSFDAATWLRLGHALVVWFVAGGHVPRSMGPRTVSTSHRRLSIPIYQPREVIEHGDV